MMPAEHCLLVRFTKNIKMNSLLIRLNTYKRFIILFALIIAADTFIKLLVSHSFEFDTRHHVLGFLYLAPIVNNTYTNVIISTLIEASPDMLAQMFFLAALLFLLNISLIILKRIAVSFRIQMIVLAVSVLVIAYISPFLSKMFPLHLTIVFVSYFSKAVVLLFYLTMFYISSNDFPRFMWIVIISAGLSNLIGFFYPPYGVIDYIYLDLPQNKALSAVFNLADAAIFVGYVLLIIYMFAFPVIRILNRKRRN